MNKVQQFIAARAWVKSVEGSTVTLNEGCFFVGSEDTVRSFKNVREAALGSAKKHVMNTLAPVKAEKPKKEKVAKAPKAEKAPKVAKPKKEKAAKAAEQVVQSVEEVQEVPEGENFVEIPTLEADEYTYDEDVEYMIADILAA